MEALSQNAEALFSNLEKFLKTETVVGEAITVGETTLIPLISVTFGCGTGSGTGNDDKGSGGTGGGLGAGARISPNSILVIKNGEVTLLATKGKTNLSSLVEMVPELVSKINVKLGKRGTDSDSPPNTTTDEASDTVTEGANE